MKTIAHRQLVLAVVISALVAPLHAQEANASTSASWLDWSGWIAPTLSYFNDNDSRAFLRRYDDRRAWGGGERSGFYGDADFRLVGASDERNVFVFERNGYGRYNHHTRARFDTDVLGASAYYNGYRSGAGTLKYLYSPGQVSGGIAPAYFYPAASNTNSGYAAQFNDDSGQSHFNIDRNTYGAALKLKSDALNGVGALAIKYDGYSREGNRFASHVLGGSNVSGGAARVLQRWRGFDMPVDETMNRATVTASASPGGFQLSYEGAVEKFDNQSDGFRIGDFSSASPFLVPSVNPLHFMPDSTQVSNNFRVSTTAGSTAFAAGYSLSILDQDSFSAQQVAVGYDRGNIQTKGAFFDVSSNVFDGVALDGFVKYHERDNTSDFPVAGLISAASDQTLGVRIDYIESLSYGLSAAFRPDFWRSSVTAGWKREDKDRDLSWTAVAVPGRNGIQPQRSLYSETSLSDELYVNWVARPAQGVMLRLTPSYVWADDTGLITEPEEAFNLKSSVSYVADAGWMLSGYYHYKNRKNSTKYFVNAQTAPVADGPATPQDAHAIQNSAGVSISKPIGEWINVTANLGWMQDDFETWFLQSSRRRFEGPNNPIVFLAQDRPNYNVDSTVFSLNGDWQAKDALRLDAGYTYSQSNGHTASGMVYDALPEIDGRIDSAVHSFEFGASYALQEKLSLRATYTYDHYHDSVYEALSGGANAIVLGVTVDLQ